MEAPGVTLEQPTVHAAMADTRGELIGAIADVDRAMASLAAVRAELIEQARQWSVITEAAGSSTRGSSTRGWSPEVVARRVLVTELACALRISERSAETLLAHSRMLMNELPGTAEALRGGAISYRHVEKICDHAASLPESARSAFEQSVLPAAARMTPAAFDQKARRVRETLHPESIEARTREAADRRSVSVDPGQDGMAWLTVNLQAEKAHAIYDRLTDIALALRGPDEQRTLAHLRADVFAELLIDGVVPDSGLGAGIAAKVLVTVPVLTLLGHDIPASLDGYGPISPDVARELAADAPSFTRLLTHPETGAVLSVGRERYRPPADLAAWLRVRDGTCRFPGCGRRARRCDLDHTDDWAKGGATAHDNLAHLCEAHHRLKHHTPWTVRQTGGGALEWTSPSGLRYTTVPEIELPVSDSRAISSPDPTT